MGSHQLMDAGCKNAAGKNNKNIPLYKDMKGKEKTAENTDMKIRGGGGHKHSLWFVLWSILMGGITESPVEHSCAAVLRSSSLVQSASLKGSLFE
jgi:hypothetical protein